MPKKKEDFLSLWKKESKSAPSSSIIAGLQQQVATKDKEIDALNQKIISLKTRLNEDISIMEQTEDVIKKQQEEIEILRKRRGTSARSALLSPKKTSSAGSEDSDPQAMKYKMKIKELEDKLYIFSALPDRISGLEERLEKQNKMIEKYQQSEKKLKNTIKSLTLEGTDGMVEDLQKKVKEQEEEIANLQERLEESATSIDLSFSSDRDAELAKELEGVKKNLVATQEQYAQLQQQFTAKESALTEAVAKNDILRKTVAQLQESAGASDQVQQLQQTLAQKDQQLQQLQQELAAAREEASTQASSADAAEVTALEKEKEDLEAQIADLQEKNQDLTLRFENLVASVQESQRKDSTLAKLKETETQLVELKDKYGQLEVDYKQAREKAEGAASKIAELEAQVRSAKASAAIPAKEETSEEESLKQQVQDQKARIDDLQSQLVDLPKLKRAAEERDVLQLKVEDLQQQAEINKTATSGGDIRSLASDLQKRLSVQKGLVKKLKAENADLKAQANSAGELKQLQARVKQLEQELEQAQKAPAAASGGASSLGGDLGGLVQELQRKLNHNKVALRNREERIKELETELRDYRAREDLITRKMEEVEERVAAVEARESVAQKFEVQVTQQEQDLNETKQALQQVTGEKEALAEQLAKTQGQLKDREAELKELEDRIETLREALAAQ